MFRKHRVGAIVMAACLCAVTAQQFTASSDAPKASAASTFNYAEALQKSLYFYEVQQAGELPDWNRVEWRGDSITCDEIPGGWYDAGDHVKFNLPMAYSASMLAWGLYQYPDGVEACGEMKNYVNNLEFVLDYLAACDKGSKIVYQIGNGTVDHTWWGPVELYEYGMSLLAECHEFPTPLRSMGLRALELVHGDMPEQVDILIDYVNKERLKQLPMVSLLAKLLLKLQNLLA